MRELLQRVYGQVCAHPTLVDESVFDLLKALLDAHEDLRFSLKGTAERVAALERGAEPASPATPPTCVFQHVTRRQLDYWIGILESNDSHGRKEVLADLRGLVVKSIAATSLAQPVPDSPLASEAKWLTEERRAWIEIHEGGSREILDLMIRRGWKPPAPVKP